MWIEKVIPEEGVRYKYREWVTDPVTKKKFKVSVTLKGNNKYYQKAARDELQAKFLEMTQTAADRKAAKLAVLTLCEVLDEWHAYTLPTIKVRTAANHMNYIKRIKRAVDPSLLFIDFTPAMAERIVRQAYCEEMLSYIYSQTILTTIQRMMKYAKKPGISKISAALRS